MERIILGRLLFLENLSRGLIKVYKQISNYLVFGQKEPFIELVFIVEKVRQIIWKYLKRFTPANLGINEGIKNRLAIFGAFRKRIFH